MQEVWIDLILLCPLEHLSTHSKSDIRAATTQPNRYELQFIIDQNLDQGSRIAVSFLGSAEPFIDTALNDLHSYRNIFLNTYIEQIVINTYIIFSLYIVFVKNTYISKNISMFAKSKWL